MITPSKLLEAYKKGENISALLRKEKNHDYTEEEIIEISYDLQTGSYIEAMNNTQMANHKMKYSKKISEIILSLCLPKTILEAGIGEGTTLSGVLNNIPNEIKSFGFDISWSRICYAKKWLIKNKHSNVSLCTANLLQIPFLDNSIDIVYTSHSIEPNGGKEKEILKELYRITNKYLILLEPGYEFASDSAKERMDSHNYCKNIKNISLSLGYKVIEHKLFDYSVNPNNPTAITIIEKENSSKVHDNVYACPKYKTPLTYLKNSFFSKDALSVYPIIDGIPCLRIENSIFASKFKEDI